MDSLVLPIVLSLLVVSVSGHGKLSQPASRGGVGYEEGPVSGATGADFVCRNGVAGTPAVTLTAGGKTTLQWGFGAAHVGDCALFLSYDYAKTRVEQKYFKIANFPDCNKDNAKPVEVTLPAWLPSGQAVMRWDWYALHVYPKVEFYAQCVDVTVVAGNSPKTIDQISTYVINGIYPTSGDQATGKFWNPFTNPQWKMEGPACANDITGNCCDTSGYTRTGYLASTCKSSGTSPPTTPTVTGAPTVTVTSAPTVTGATGSPTVTATSAPTTTPVVSLCEIYTVKSGDTMTKIAAAYTAGGYSLTALELCQFNKGSTVELSACDIINIGDNLVIPGKNGSPCKAAATNAPTPMDSSALLKTSYSLVMLVSLVVLCAV